MTSSGEPAQPPPGLKILLLLFDSLLLESLLLVALALRGSTGNEEKSGPACPFPPAPTVPCVPMCVTHIALVLFPRFTLGLFPQLYPPGAPFPPHTLEPEVRCSTVRSLALSWSASPNAGIEQTRVKSQPTPCQWRDLGQALGLPEPWPAWCLKYRVVRIRCGLGVKLLYTRPDRCR